MARRSTQLVDRTRRAPGAAPAGAPSGCSARPCWQRKSSARSGSACTGRRASSGVAATPAWIRSAPCWEQQAAHASLMHAVPASGEPVGPDARHAGSGPGGARLHSRCARNAASSGSRCRRSSGCHSKRSVGIRGAMPETRALACVSIAGARESSSLSSMCGADPEDGALPGLAADCALAVGQFCSHRKDGRHGASATP